MFDVIHLSVADTDNILNAALNADSSCNCNSAIFAGICYKLAAFYDNLADTHYRAAKRDNRISKRERLALRELVYERADAAYAWESRFNALLSYDITGMTRTERRQREHNIQVFCNLLFKHWDNENRVWQFNGIIFG